MTFQSFSRCWGLNDGLSFERNFSRRALAIMKPIRDECARITDGALKNEIIAALRSKDWSEFNDSDINQMAQNIEHNTLENLPDEIPLLTSTISYDMGWQRRACGRAYDSSSGRGFSVGCLTGEIIRIGVLQKDALFVEHTSTLSCRLRHIIVIRAIMEALVRWKLRLLE